MYTITFDMYQTLALAVAALLLGTFLRRRIAILERFCIPAPVVGGLIFAILSCVLYSAHILEISYTGTGMAGGCPAEKDNEGTFYIGNDTEFRPAEKIEVNKEFCDCSFAWHFHEGDACGSSEGRTLPAFAEEESNEYSRMALTAENAAAIPCRQVLGAYIVRFERVRAGRDS